jgi:hypothetical protein
MVNFEFTARLQLAETAWNSLATGRDPSLDNADNRTVTHHFCGAVHEFCTAQQEGAECAHWLHNYV